jgi:uncharacterized membrane protein
LTYALKLFKKINWRLIAAALCAVGILHILATLAAPELTPSRAFNRLAGKLPINTMQLLPPIAPDNQPLPFLSPDARYALCRFDTTDGAVSLTASLPGPGWVLALYSPEGENFFASIAQPGRRREVSLLLVPSEERFNLLAAHRPRTAENKRNTTLRVGAQKGLAIVRAPDMGSAYDARNLALLKRARCTFRKI